MKPFDFGQGNRHQRWAKRVKGCVECGATALYRVGTKGYCKSHRAEALKRERYRQSTVDSQNRDTDTHAPWCRPIDSSIDEPKEQ